MKNRKKIDSTAFIKSNPSEEWQVTRRTSERLTDSKTTTAKLVKLHCNANAMVNSIEFNQKYALKIIQWNL